MKHIKKGLLLSLLITTSTYGFQEVYDFHNIRQKAMGGTQVATIKNSTSFYQNPAFLALEKTFKIEIPKIEISINKDLVDKMSEFSSLTSSSEDEEAQIDTLKNLVPLKAAAGGNILPVLTFTKKGFGLTAYGKSKIGAQLKRKTSPTLYVQGQTNIVSHLAIATQFDVANSPLYVGISPKYTYRTIFYDKQTGNETFVMTQSDLLKLANDLADFEPDVYNLSGFGLDVGALYSYTTSEGEGLAGITVQNLFSNLSGTQVVSSNTVTETKDVSVNDSLIVTLGNTMIYDLPVFKKFEFSVDYNLVAPTTSFLKRVHIGFEKKLTPILSLRGGLNQGFIVGGFGVNLFVVKFDYAYFAEEMSNSIGKNTIKSHNIQFGLLF